MLLLVVGPPGAGKDTLLAAVRPHFAENARVRFIRRVLTRAQPGPADDGCELLDAATFAARRDAGGFAATWRSNGVFYGVPTDAVRDEGPGRVALCNVSRLVIAQLAQRVPTRVVEITAPVNVLGRRLAAAGRADALDAARRLCRVVGLPPGVPHEVLANDGTVEQGARKLVAAIGRALETHAADT